MPYDRVSSAIDRWEVDGLVSSEQGAALREDHAVHSTRTQRRRSQYTVSITAGVLLVVAGVTFLAWSWPRMGDGGRSLLIWAAGVLVAALGVRMVRARRWVPVARALQSSGLALLLAAYAYSQTAWPSGTLGGVAVGTLSLATPIMALVLFARASWVMSGVTVAIGYGFVAVFLHRALSLPDQALVWTLDGVLVATLLAMALTIWRQLRSGPGEDGGRSVSPPVLSAFVVSVYAGFLFVILTATVALEMADVPFLALDAWLLLVTAVAVWAIHWAPTGLANPHYVHGVALSVGIAIPLGFATPLELYDAPPPVAALVVASVGVAGLWYGLGRSAMSLIVTSCAAIVCAAWYLGAEFGDNIGSVIALAVVAAVFFLGASRIGRERAAGEAKPGGVGDAE